MLRPVFKKLKQPYQDKHSCRSLANSECLKVKSKDGDTKILLVCIFEKYGYNWSVFGLDFEEKCSVFGLYYRLFVYRMAVSQLVHKIDCLNYKGRQIVPIVNLLF